MIELPRLEARPDSDELVFHFKGLAEAFEFITGQIEELDKRINEDLDVTTDILGRLEAELYTHLPYHLKELRRPFSRLFRALCRDLERLEREVKKPGPKRLKKGNRKPRTARSTASRPRPQS